MLQYRILNMSRSVHFKSWYQKVNGYYSWTIATVISRALAVAAVMEPPLADSKSWSCCLVFALFSCLVAEVVVVNVVVVMMVIMTVVVDAALFCFPPQHLAKVVPMHQWKCDPLVHIANTVEWRGPRHLRRNLHASIVDRSKMFPSFWCVFAVPLRGMLPEMEANPSRVNTIERK